MGPERWQQVERIYHAVAARPREERAPLLDRECAGDADLRAEVERMLAVESRGIGFLEVPAMEVAARALAEAHLLHHVGGSCSFPAGCNFENGLVTRFLSA